jgi:hypothetical protein
VKRIALAVGVVLVLTSCANTVAGTGTNTGLPAASTTSAAQPTPTDTPATDAPTTDTPATDTPAGPKKFSFDETATVTEGGKDAMSLKIDAPNRYTSPPDQYGVPPQNGLYVVFRVTAIAILKEDVNPFDFYVREADGSHYDPTYGFEPALHDATLAPGERIRGKVTFDVPSGHGTLVYAPASEALGEWEF